MNDIRKASRLLKGHSRTTTTNGWHGIKVEGVVVIWILYRVDTYKSMMGTQLFLRRRGLGR